MIRRRPIERPTSPEGSGAATLARATRSITAAMLAGLLAGPVVGGLGSRIVMRISAIASGPETRGAVTESGFPVGQISFEGTIGLLVFGGIFSGIFGGVLYLVVGPWLPGRLWLRSLSFGLVLFLLLGYEVINVDNLDFLLLDPALLNVIMFASLFLLFGLLFVPLADRFSRAIPPNPFRSGPWALASLVALGMLAFGSVGVMSFFGGGEGVVRGPWIIAALLVIMVLARLGRRRWANTNPEGGSPRLEVGAAAAGYLSLAGACLAGLIRDIDAITAIL